MLRRAAGSAPADGKVAWTAHDLFEGVTLPPTAAEALDLADVAVILGPLNGRLVTRTLVTEEEYAAQLPPPAVATLLALFRAARAGEFAATDPTLG